MGDTTISWCDKTWNPVRGCSRVSEGCRNCYAERVTGINHYGSVRSNGCPSWNTRAVPYCSSHEARLRNEFTPQMIHDRYEPLLLAYVGDELWIALECALFTLHEVMAARRLERSAA